jgi:hypothetical protein
MSGGAASAKTANYVLVAADAGTAISMTSTSATTITVNTGLFAAGDTVFIQNLGSGVSTITAGTATVNTSSSLALAQYEGGTLYFTSASASLFFKADGAAAGGGSFTKITSGSFSAVAGVNIDSIFSATYKNYLVLIYNLGSADSPFDQTLSLQFRYSGSTESGSNYYGSNWQINNSNTQTSSGFSAAGQATLMKNVGDSGRSFVYSYFTHVGNSSQSAAYFSDYYTGTGQSRGLSSALVAQNRTYDGIRLTCSSNISGDYIVYGLEN